MILERVTRYLTSPEADSFADLALAAFAYQFETIEPYRLLCQRRGVTPFVWLPNRSGNISAKSRRVRVRNNSECISATPLVE